MANWLRKELATVSFSILGADRLRRSYTLRVDDVAKGVFGVFGAAAAGPLFAPVGAAIGSLAAEIIVDCFDDSLYLEWEEALPKYAANFGVNVITGCLGSYSCSKFMLAHPSFLDLPNSAGLQLGDFLSKKVFELSAKGLNVQPYLERELADCIGVLPSSSKEFSMALIVPKSQMLDSPIVREMRRRYNHEREFNLSNPFYRDYPLPSKEYSLEQTSILRRILSL